MAPLVAGPTAAMRRSARAVGGSPSSSATPPSIHSVTESTRTPWRRATSAWANSCAASDPRNSAAVTSAAAHRAPAGADGSAPGRTDWARMSATRITVTTTDQFRPTGTPPIVPSLNVCFMATSL
ncbi:hypothetical protein GCM10009527_027930 [Actinomadura nitritigenes]